MSCCQRVRRTSRSHQRHSNTGSEYEAGLSRSAVRRGVASSSSRKLTPIVCSMTTSHDRLGRGIQLACGSSDWSFCGSSDPPQPMGRPRSKEQSEDVPSAPQPFGSGSDMKHIDLPPPLIHHHRRNLFERAKPARM
ncbi:uncharacterized protein MEPE_03010 [Melanopsichium pennsylvanicum]|uniref:Uncharacterized protein n=1 Tax=Melanopsichium pennsylvanicum TaxID=63383 RepID=A0AAJ5C525_9BASI|nr:uncharacterized protein MEPE_03010 [Melanopsichium pennsylvanicum]